MTEDSPAVCVPTFRAPHSSTVSLSSTTVMRKLAVCSSSLKIRPLAIFLAPEGNSPNLDNSEMFHKNSLKQKDNQTDGGFAKLVIRNLAGDVGAHQDADVHL